MKLISIFIKNVLRSVATMVVVAIVAGLLTGLVLLLWDFIAGLLNSVAVDLLQKEAFAHEMNLIEQMVANAVLGFGAAFLWLALGTVKDWFYNGKVDCMKHPPHAVFGTLWIVIVPLAFAGVAVWMCVTGYDAMYALLEKSNDANNLSFFAFLPLIIPAVAASQIAYGIAITGHYIGWQTCNKCKRMFCIEYDWEGSKTHTTTKYKTRTEKEKVGALYAGDKKIVDVEGNVTRTYADTTNITIDSYKGVCVRCGEETSNSTSG